MPAHHVTSPHMHARGRCQHGFVRSQAVTNRKQSIHRSGPLCCSVMKPSSSLSYHPTPPSAGSLPARRRGAAIVELSHSDVGPASSAVSEGSTCHSGTACSADHRTQRQPTASAQSRFGKLTSPAAIIGSLAVTDTRAAGTKHPRTASRQLTCTELKAKQNHVKCSGIGRCRPN